MDLLVCRGLYFKYLKGGNEMVTVEIPRGKDGASGSGREIRIEMPSGVEFSEEEMRKIAAATENEIVDVIRYAQARLAAKTKTVPETVKVEVQAQAGLQ
jgi:hypothetical protein